MQKIKSIPTLGLSEQEWLNLRFNGLGGSDVAAAMGLSKWRTPTELYLEKVNKVSDYEESQPAEWGKRLEDVVARAYAEKTGNRIRRRNAILTNPAYPWLFANVDRLIIGKKKGLEVKTASTYVQRDWGDEGTDEVPDYYKTQAYVYMLVTGYRSWDFAVLMGGNDFRIYSVEFNERIGERVLAETRAFWYDHVLAQLPPPPVNLDDVRRIYRKDDGSEIDGDAYIAQAINRLSEIKTELKVLGSEEADIKTTLGQFMGEHSVLLLEGKKRATFKAQSSNRVDSNALKTNHPDVYASVVKTSESRVLRTY